MIALRGKTEEYFFDEHRPFTRPGKFSTVYKGENSIGEPVIIKKLINGGNKNPFEDKVSHPAFIKTIDGVVDRNIVYLIRPFISGVPLISLKGRKWFNSDENCELFISIIKKIGDALSSLHHQNLVHLDIRPHNILVENIDQLSNLRVSIIDLEMLRPFYDSKPIANFPLLYSAPELLLKRNQLIDQRTDIYAFAYTIYEVLFNLIPLRQSNPELLMHLMLTMKLPMISNHDSIVKVLQKASAKSIFKLPPAKLSGEEIDQILITGMDSRYQNIDAFLSDMQDLITVNQSRWIRLLQLFNR